MGTQSDGDTTNFSSQERRGEDSTNQTNDSALSIQSTTPLYINATLLQQLNEERFQQLMVVVVYLVVMMVVGILGNVSILYIFCRKMKRTPQTVLFIWLAVFDVVSCVIGMPSEIADVRHYFLFDSPLVCKILRFAETIPPVSSANVLIVIAADRYRRVCRPLHGQMEIGHARIGVALSLLVAVTVAGPSISLYGNRRVPTPVPGLRGIDCSVQDKYQGQYYPLLYELVFGVSFLVYCVVLVVIYIRVWLETARHRKYMRSHEISSVNLSCLLHNNGDSSRSGTPEPVRKSNRVSGGNLDPASKDKRLSTGTTESALKVSTGRPVSEIVDPLRNRYSRQPDLRQSHDGNISLSSDRLLPDGQNKGHNGSDIQESTKQAAHKQGYTVSFVSETVKAESGEIEPEVPQNGNSALENSTEVKVTKVLKQQTSLQEPARKREAYARSISQPSTYRNSASCPDSPSTARKISRLQLLPKLRTALKANKLTVMSVAVTVVFVVSYLPFLCLVTVGTVIVDFEYTQTGYSLVLYNLFMRSYFVNSVANVFIYGAMNSEFRANFKRLFRR